MSQDPMDAAEETIGPDSYKVLMLEPLAFADLLVDLTDVFGPALGAVGGVLVKAGDTKEAFSQLLDGIKSGDGADNISPDAFGDSLERAITGIIDRMEKHKLRAMIELMRGMTSVQKGENWPKLESIFAIHFRGRPKAMFQWLAFALKAQFRDFF